LRINADREREKMGRRRLRTRKFSRRQTSTESPLLPQTPSPSLSFFIFTRSYAVGVADHHERLGVVRVAQVARNPGRRSRERCHGFYRRRPLVAWAQEGLTGSPLRQNGTIRGFALGSRTLGSIGAPGSVRQARRIGFALFGSGARPRSRPRGALRSRQPAGPALFGSQPVSGDGPHAGLEPEAAGCAIARFGAAGFGFGLRGESRPIGRQASRRTKVVGNRLVIFS